MVVRVWLGTAPRTVSTTARSTATEPLIRLLDEADARYEFIDNNGSVFYFNTDLDAPKGRIIAIDTANPARENWKEILPEQSDTLDFVTVVNHQFVMGFLNNANHVLAIYSLDGEYVRQIELPEIGSVTQLSGKPDETEMFIGFTSFLRASTIFRYDFEHGQITHLPRSRCRFQPVRFHNPPGLFHLERRDGSADVPGPPQGHQPERRQSDLALRLRRI